MRDLIPIVNISEINILNLGSQHTRLSSRQAGQPSHSEARFMHAVYIHKHTQHSQKQTVEPVNMLAAPTPKQRRPQAQMGA